MKKTLLALAIAGLSANAFAAVDLTPATGGVIAEKYAKQIKETNGKYELDTSTTAQDLTFKFDTVQSPGNAQNTKYTLTINYGSDVTVEAPAGGLTLVGATNATIENVDRILDGASGIVQYNFELKNTDGLNPAYVEGLTVDIDKVVTTGQVNVTPTVKVIENSIGTSIFEKTATVLRWADSFEFLTDEFLTNRIDVVTASTKFEGGNTTEAGSMIVNHSADVMDATSTLIGAGGLLAVDMTLNAENGLAAFVDGGLVELVDGLGAQVADFVIDEDDNTVAKASSKTVPTAGYTLRLTVADDNTQEILKTPLTMTFKPEYTAAANLVFPSMTIDFADLEKNGSEAFVDYLGAPEADHSGYIRITNRSDIEGKVFVKVIRDNGDNVFMDLSDIEGQPENLEARASTTLISSAALIEAAGFENVTKGEKFRVEASAETPAGTLGVQSFSMSMDNNSFSRN